MCLVVDSLFSYTVLVGIPIVCKLLEKIWRKAVFLIRLLAFSAYLNQTNLYLNEPLSLCLYISTHVKLQQPYELTVTFLELGKLRLREVKDLSRNNGSKEKTWIQDIMTPNSRLSTATLHVVSMAVTAPLVWNYYFTLRYFQNIFSLHTSLPTSHYRVFIPMILMLLDSRPCVLHITNDRELGFPQFSGVSFLEEVLLKMQSGHQVGFASAKLQFPPWPQPPPLAPPSARWSMASFH